MIATHLIIFFLNAGGVAPPATGAVADAPLALLRFSKLGVR